MSTTPSENLVWKQFKKRPAGVFSLYVMLVLFGVAVYAPLLANEQPLALYTTHPQLYAYFHAGLSTVHDILEDGVKNQQALQQQESDASRKYDEERTELIRLTDSSNKVGDAYDSARNDVNRAADKLEELAAQRDLARASNDTGKVSAIEAEMATLSENKSKREQELKVLGAEKASVKRQLDEHRGSQNAYNEEILRTRFRLNFVQQSGAIRVNLSRLGFGVDEELNNKIQGMATRYEAIFPRLTSANTENDVVQELEALRKETASIAPALVKEHFIYRWTFPAFADLTWSDRFFMIGYALLLTTIAMWGRFRLSSFQKVAGVVLVSVVLALLTGYVGGHLPSRNYRTVLIDNVRDGYAESSAWMAPVFYGMNENRVEEQYQRPSFAADENGRRSLHLLGTDDSGRDVLSRMIWGARVSLSVGFVAVSIYMFLGIVLGALAGYFAGKVDMILSRFTEVVICFPSFFLILTVIAFIGPSIYNVMIIIGLTSWTGVARLTRAEFLRLRNLEFVLAARAAGISGLSIMFNHVLPNAMTPIMVSAAFGFAGTILTESGLSFLGFGVQEPFPSWGQMVSNGTSNPTLYWWLFFVPALSLFLTVTFSNVASNTFRDAADPRLRM